MATTVEEILLQVKSADAVSNIAELKNNIKLLGEALKDVDATEEENQRTVALLKENQDALRDAMHDTGATAEELLKASEGLVDVNGRAIGSYNDLVHTMADLKAAWRSTTDETERQRLGSRINELNNALKDLDSDVGTFSRNVGNYKSHWDAMPASFKATAGAAGNMIAPITNVKNGLTAMSTTPVVAVMGLLANVLTRVIDSLKSSESATNSLTSSMSGFHAVAEAVNNILVGLGKEIAEMVGWVSELTAEIFHLKTAQEQQNDVAALSADLAIENRQLMIKNAASEKYAAEEKAKAADREKYSLEQRIEAQKNAAAAEENAAQRSEEYARHQYEYIKQRNALGKSTKEQLDEEARAEAALFKAQAATAATRRANILAMRKLMAEDKRTTTKSVSELDKLIDSIGKNITKTNSDIAKFIRDITEETWIEIKDTTDESYKEMQEAAARYASSVIESMDHEAETKLKWNAILIDNDDERARAEYEINNKLKSDKLNLLRQFADEALANVDTERYLQYQQQIADMEVEIEMDKAAELKRVRDKDAADRKERTQQAISDLRSLAGATSSILGSIADMYEQDEANAEANAKKVKGLRISESVINTISGAIGAFAQSAASIPPPMGQIIGALSAAAVTATGMAQIAQIKRTSIGSGSTPSISAIASAPSMPLTLPETRNITSQSEEDRLNQMASTSKVYILQSDIEASNNASKVRVEESSF